MKKERGKEKSVLYKFMYCSAFRNITFGRIFFKEKENRRNAADRGADTGI